MDHRITYDKVRNGPKAEEFTAVQCRSQEHGLAQLIRMPWIRDEEWLVLLNRFLSIHSPEN